MKIFWLIVAAGLAQAQETFKMPDCSQIDQIACHEAKKAEAKRVNKANSRALKESIKTCSPIKIVTYYGEKAVKTTKLEGEVDGRCKMVITTHQGMGVKQTCLFDEKAMTLMRKDPKTYSSDDKMASRILFKEQCETKMLDPKAQADFEKHQGSMEKLRNKIIDKMGEIFSAKAKKLRSDCLAGDKNACAEYDSGKKEMLKECKKPENKKACESLKDL